MKNLMFCVLKLSLLLFMFVSCRSSPQPSPPPPQPEQVTITADNYPPAFDEMLRQGATSRVMFDSISRRFISEGRISREEATWINYVYFLENVAAQPNYSVEITTRENIDGTTTVTRTINLLPRYRFITDRVSRANTTLSINTDITGDDVSNYFMFIYRGNSWRFYESVAFNVDGTVFRIPMIGNRRTTAGGVIEIYAIPISSFSLAFLSALRNATSINYQMTASRFNDGIHILSENAVEAIRSFL